MLLVALPLSAVEPRADSLQAFMDDHTVAGAVTRVATRDKVVSLDAVRCADRSVGGGGGSGATWTFSRRIRCADRPLWRMGDRVTLTPHVTGYSPRVAERRLALLLDNVGWFLRG